MTPVQREVAPGDHHRKPAAFRLKTGHSLRPSFLFPAAMPLASRSPACATLAVYPFTDCAGQHVAGGSREPETGATRRHDHDEKDRGGMWYPACRHRHDCTKNCRTLAGRHCGNHGAMLSGMDPVEHSERYGISSASMRTHSDYGIRRSNGAALLTGIATTH